MSSVISIGTGLSGLIPTTTTNTSNSSTVPAVTGVVTGLLGGSATVTAPPTYAVPSASQVTASLAKLNVPTTGFGASLSDTISYYVAFPGSITSTNIVDLTNSLYHYVITGASDDVRLPESIRRLKNVINKTSALQTGIVTSVQALLFAMDKVLESAPYSIDATFQYDVSSGNIYNINGGITTLTNTIVLTKYGQYVLRASINTQDGSGSFSVACNRNNTSYANLPPTHGTSSITNKQYVWIIVYQRTDNTAPNLCIQITLNGNCTSNIFYLTEYAL